MTANRFRQVRHLFEAVLERPTEGRTAFLDEATHGDLELRREVQQLLAAHSGSTGLLDYPALDAAGERWEGRRIGPYEILRELGRGGMGTVYLATRADHAFDRLVAIKVVRPEVNPEEVLRRFQRERQILAALDHPHIARLLDAGTTSDGLPYFVMEYVDGRPIDRYCDEMGLDIAGRLRLFEDVCDAVEYAHSQQVVHRDLKPANILVTDASNVKLLDFGIARLLTPDSNRPAEPVTRTELRLMTPEYASPEQVRGEPAGRTSDVYSLGVVLYELLTGTQPYQLRSRLLHEVVRVICEEEPTRPSTAVTQSATPELIQSRQATPDELRALLSGDLDSILLKALAKEQDSRYQSPQEFRDDLQRHCEGQRVSARANALRRPLAQVFKKHPLAVTAVATILLGLAGGWIRLDPMMTRFYAIMAGSFGLGAWLAIRYRIVPVPKQDYIRRIAYIVVTMLAINTLLVRLPNDRGETVITTTVVACALYMLWLTARWCLREHIAGPVLLDASPERRTLAYIGSALPFLCGILFAVQAFYAKQMFWMRVVVTGSQALSGVFALLTRQRTEVRQTGLFVDGAYFRWNRIRHYHWEAATSAHAVLNFKVSRRLPLSGSLKIPIATEHKEEMDRLLQEHLAEWPR